MERIVDNNKQAEFNYNFNNTWDFYAKTVTLGMAAVVIYVIASGMIGFFVEGITGFGMLSEEFMEDFTDSDPSIMLYKVQDFYSNNLNLILLSRFSTELILLLTFPLAGGFMLVCREIDERGYSGFNTLWKAFRSEYWGRLMVLALIYFVVSKIALVLFVFPAVYIWVAACIACPYVMFKGMSGLDAFKASIKTVNEHWFSVFKVLLVASLIGFAGYLICGIGRIVSYPFVLVTIYMLYKNLVGFSEDSIDEIGVD